MVSAGLSEWGRHPVAPYPARHLGQPDGRTSLIHNDAIRLRLARRNSRTRTHNNGTLCVRGVHDRATYAMAARGLFQQPSKMSRLLSIATASFLPSFLLPTCLPACLLPTPRAVDQRRRRRERLPRRLRVVSTTNGFKVTREDSAALLQPLAAAADWDDDDAMEAATAARRSRVSDGNSRKIDRQLGTVDLLIFCVNAGSS